jgi:hypothetical protein
MAQYVRLIMQVCACDFAAAWRMPGMFELSHLELSMSTPTRRHHEITARSEGMTHAP